MSIKWMTRVWSSPAPSHPTDRLMLLALADNANDEGVCWPCVETLRRRCSLKTIRGARKVLERLEVGSFIERITRPGRSNVYQLLEAPGETPERADRGPSTPTPELRDRGGGTGGPGTPERADRVPRNPGSAITNIEPSIEPSHNNNTERPAIRGDVVVDSCEERLVRMLITRGMHEPVAVRLVEHFGEDAIRGQVAHYDQLCSRGEAPRGVGWLVKAIEEGYPLPVREGAASKRYTYQEMLAWCEARGDLSLTRGFTPVKQDGDTFFQLSRSTRHASSHEPSSTDHHAPRSQQE